MFGGGKKSNGNSRSHQEARLASRVPDWGPNIQANNIYGKADARKRRSIIVHAGAERDLSSGCGVS
jgi:hypothetical protein